MIIAVGSTNQAKVCAVKEVLLDSIRFSQAKVISLSVGSDVSDQPLSLQETIQGAKNRAKNAFNQCDCQYSFGIESGLMEACETSSGYLHISACSIYDGIHYSIGLSTGFEVPPQILELVLNKKMDLSQACLHSGISNNTKIGSTEGLIGILTKGKVDRKEYSKQCVITAVLQLENEEWYISNTVDDFFKMVVSPELSKK
jgi:inosine/xanthosine triphosphatase